MAEGSRGSISSNAPMGIVIEQFKTDPLYSQFLQDDFDGKAVAAKAVQNLAITDYLGKISAGISLVEREIRNEVGEKYDELLSHATDIESLEKSLQETFHSVKSLKVISDRLQSRINESFTKVEQHTLMLRRLHDTCELSRSVARIASVCKQLRATANANGMTASKDLIKSAQLISEVDFIVSNVGESIHGVNMIRGHLKYVGDLKADLIKQCHQLLETGVEAQNAAQMVIALQSMHNMGILKMQVQLLCEKYKLKVSKLTREALDVQRLSQPDPSIQRAPGRATLGAGGTMFRSKLWASIEDLVASIVNVLCQVRTLESVMSKRKEANTHTAFADIIAEQTGEKLCLSESLWNDMASSLASELINSANNNTFVRQAFEGEYPKLLKIFTSKLESPEQISQIHVEQFENAYLSHSLSRLLDSANHCLSTTPPLATDVNAIVNVIMSEMKVTESIGSCRLLDNVARNVAKTVQHFATKAEETVIKAQLPEANQVMGPANQVQRNNATAVHLLTQFALQFDTFLDTLNQSSPCVIETRASLKHIDSAIESSLSPLIAAISNAIEAILLTMHDEKYDFATKGKEVQCSLYMRELQGFMARVQSEYIALYPQTPTIKNMVRQMAGRTIELFLRHVTLIRPLSDGGCLRLSADFAQLEQLIAYWQPISDTGANNQPEDTFCVQFKILRALRPLLLQPVEQLVNSPVIGSVLPYSKVLHFLFSRAPPEMKSPHVAASWSIQKYSNWLDSHPSEKDRLVLIRGTLDSYLRWVKQKDVKQFPEIYPIINQLLATAVARCI